jgi:hypothetical protein
MSYSMTRTVLGAVSSPAAASSLSSALNLCTLTLRPKAMHQRESLHVCKSVRGNFTPADGPFCIPKGSVAA